MIELVLFVVGIISTFILARAFYRTCDAIIAACCGADHGHGQSVAVKCHCACHVAKPSVNQ